jgi:hypothetical protein
MKAEELPYFKRVVGEKSLFHSLIGSVCKSLMATVSSD